MRRIFSLAAALLLAACADQQALYGSSIRDTAVYTPAHVQTLTPLAYPVQGVNFTKYPGWAEGKEGQEVTLAYETWVTVEPEVQRACRAFPRDALIPRLHQFLGLKPATPADDARKIVLLTVAGEQPVGPTGKGLFRPCANPDVAATTCGNSLDGQPAAYVSWFANQMMGSYRDGPTADDVGYPWTRLGYTWDWSAADHRGPQEYVLPVGTVVTVRAVTTPAEYCR